MDKITNTDQTKSAQEEQQVNWLVWISGAIVLMTVMLVILMIRIEFYYRYRGEDDALQITVTALAGFIRLKRRFPLMRMGADKPNDYLPKKHSQQGKRPQHMILNILQQAPQNLPQWKKQTAGLLHILQSFLTNVDCEKLIWRSTIGTGDAAKTGTLIGWLWGIKAPLVGWGTRYLNMRVTPQLDLVPDFHRLRVETDFRCILKFRLGHAILVSIRLLHHYLHQKKQFRHVRQSETVT